MPVKSKVKISQNFVAFSEYMYFINDETTLGRVLWMAIFIWTQLNLKAIKASNIEGF